MKNISLFLLATATMLSVQTVSAQDNDTSKNKIEVKKKVKSGIHGRQVTKIKVEGKGTPDAISSAAATAATGKTHVVVARPAAQTPPPVVVVNPQPQPAKTVTRTTVIKPAPVTRTTTVTSTHTATHVTARKPVRRHLYHKPAVTTTTTTTVKKEQ